MLSRDTDWRQGSILTKTSSCALGLIEESSLDKYVVVISHDCDLPHESEKIVEVILATKIPQSEPFYANARNVRRLHLTYNIDQSVDCGFFELTHIGRQSVCKIKFGNLAELDITYILSEDERRVLKQWLAARYGRPAFPNSFLNRLNDKKIVKKLDDILKSDGTHLIGVYFDLGEERSSELLPSMPYFLRISLAYDTVKGSSARRAAENCADKITALFHKIYGSPDIATEILLDSCQAVADINFSMADLRKVDKWQTDYISLREKPPGPYLAVGETPT